MNDIREAPPAEPKVSVSAQGDPPANAETVEPPVSVSAQGDSPANAEMVEPPVSVSAQGDSPANAETVEPPVSVSAQGDTPANSSAEGDRTASGEQPEPLTSVSATAPPTAATSETETSAAPTGDDSGTASLAVAARTSDPFGPPELLLGENPRNYETQLARTCDAVKPKDFIEEIWVREVVDLTWEILRLRRLKTHFLASAAREKLYAILYSYYHRQEKLLDLTWAWARHDQAAMRQVDQMLAQIGLNVDSVMAQALADKIDDFERIDRIMMTMEACRNATIREIDRRRSMLAERLSEAVQEVDAEFKVIEPPRDAESAT